MSVKIRLRRMGTRGKPFYRVVVADSRSPRDGRFIETLGYYDPRTEPPTIKIDEERALLWLGRGAQATDTAEALLKKQDIFQKHLATKKGKVEKPSAEVEAVSPVEEPEAEKPAPARKRRTKAAVKEAEVQEAESKEAGPTGEEVSEEAAAPTRKRRTKAAAKESEASAEDTQAAEPEAASEEQSSEEQG